MMATIIKYIGITKFYIGVKNLNNHKLRQKLKVLYFIIIANLLLFIINYNYETNKFYTIEEMNQFRWQKFMSEEEYNQLEDGMSYMEVVKIVKGRGDQLTENTFGWKDEILLTQSYLITFEDNGLVSKQIYNQKKQY
ncbi:hypothetical protein D7X33_28425 [Butyricicoccus sp. 1XD8-22]|nr:hypothetical protein D7X33_28425 [Butyricicoccus sp. 1XD8-22]